LTLGYFIVHLEGWGCPLDTLAVHTSLLRQGHRAWPASPWRIITSNHCSVEAGEGTDSIYYIHGTGQPTMHFGSSHSTGESPDPREVSFPPPTLGRVYSGHLPHYFAGLCPGSFRTLSTPLGEKPWGPLLGLRCCWFHKPSSPKIIQTLVGQALWRQQGDLGRPCFGSTGVCL
jgi:hypothetical protein